MQKFPKLSRSQLRAYTLKLWREQGSICPLCKGDHILEGRSTADIVLDHCHETGRVRGALGRSCNGALGKMDNAIGRWGAKSMEYANIVPYLERVLEYYKEPLKNFIYPEHKNPEERAEAARIKRNKAQVKRRADIKAKELV